MFSHEPLVAHRASTIIYGFARGIQAELGPGVWLLPANVCPVVPLALLAAGAEFEFIDVDSSSLCLNVSEAVSRLQNWNLRRVHAVLYVRTYGDNSSANHDLNILRTSTPYDLRLIDDRCSCFPDVDVDSVDTSAADAVLYSTGYGKIVDIGRGGYSFIREGMPFFPPAGTYATDFIENQQRIWTEAASKRTFLYDYVLGRHDVRRRGWTNVEWLCGPAPRKWREYRSDIVHELMSVSDGKRKINDIYETTKGIERISSLDWRFNIFVNKKDKLLEKLFSEGLFASSHYYPSSRLFGNISSPVSERLYSQIINLFNDKYIDEDRARRVAAIVGRHVAQYGLGSLVKH